MNKETLTTALANPNVRAFLRVIRQGETSQGYSAYQTIFGGQTFTDFSDHPRIVVTKPLRNGKTVSSSAAGAYQILRKTWDGLVKQYGFTDFYPDTQDLGAVALIAGRKALDDVIAGNFASAIKKCAPEWASLPGDVYGQGGIAMSKAKAVYEQFGGTYAPAPVESTGGIMAIPIIPSILWGAIQALIPAIPTIGKLFGSGSEVSERNIKLAETVIGVVQEATGATNAQEAAERVLADPAMAAAATKAITEQWFELKEIGGGVEAAHKRNQEVAALPHGGLTSPAFIVSLLLMIPVNFAVGVVLWPGSAFDDNIKLMVVTALVTGLVGVISGYWLGTSASSARKTELANQNQPII